MNRAALLHANTAPWASPVAPQHLRLVLWAAAGDLRHAAVLASDRFATTDAEDTVDLVREAGDGVREYWAATVPAPVRRLRYRFRLEDQAGEVLWLGEDGCQEQWRPQSPYFQYAYIQEGDGLQLPAWLPGAVFYQVFPDRFADGDPAANPRGTRPWGTPPTATNCMGGDLVGIRRRLDWLAQLSVRCLYMTPIFKSPSNHKYNTTDYYRLDPHFGNPDDLQALVTGAHALGMRVLLDAVFNHSGTGFFAFRDLVRRGETSPYRDWYFPESFPVDPGRGNYRTFATGVAYMPKLNLDNPACAAYFLKVAVHWLRRAGVDGWRLDVANEVPLHFWRRLRQAVKALSPDHFILGENWHLSLDWLRGDTFDSVMHYPWRSATLDFLTGQTDARTYDGALTRLRYAYPDAVTAGLLHFLGTHDTARARTLCGGRERADLGAVLLFTAPGMPLIYYGDEVGMEGGPDPDCRRCMVWEPAGQDAATLSLYRRLAALRSRLPWLNRSRWRTLAADTGLYAYRRWDDQDGGGSLTVVVNRSARSRRLTLPLPGAARHDLLAGDVLPPGRDGLRLSLPAWGAAILADGAAARAAGDLPPVVHPLVRRP